MVTLQDFFVFRLAFFRPIEEFSSHGFVIDPQNPADFVHGHHRPKELSDNGVLSSLVLSEFKSSRGIGEGVLARLTKVAFDMSAVALSVEGTHGNDVV